MKAPRVDVTRADIEAVVQAFYSRARNDAILGPIFGAHVQDWPEHEDKIARFWANALLYEGDYDGNPMMAHMKAGNVLPEHFETWLALFEQVLKEKLPSPQRDQWSLLVQRIARGLSMGLSDYQKPQGAVPQFLNM